MYNDESGVSKLPRPAPICWENVFAIPLFEGFGFLIRSINCAKLTVPAQNALSAKKTAMTATFINVTRRADAILFTSRLELNIYFSFDEG